MDRKSQEILFGTAYYLEYMPHDRLEIDMQMMKKAGMNVIRIAESTWSTLEPSEGVFDFTCLDRVLDAAKRYDLKVIIGTPTYAVPSWLVKKDADVLVTTKNGRANYGHRQLINLLNPTFRYHAEQVIRRLAEHTAGLEQVIGFQIDNETKHYGNMGAQMQQLFVEYLKQKFQTTDQLNQAFVLPYWSNSIDSWEDFPDMQGCCNGGLAGEFEKFQRHAAARYLEWQAQMIREYKREDQFITHNLDFEWKKFGADIAQDGYSYGVQPDMDHYEAAKCLTTAGCDIYHPTQDELTGAEIAFGGDSIRSLKEDNYFVLECQAQAFKNWTPYPGQLRLQAYSHLASGADGVMYWNWHSIHNGYETYWRGLLSHDLKENPTYEEACFIGREMRRLKEHLVHLKKSNQVALVVDHHSLTALKWFPIDRDLSYNDVVRWMYDSLYEMNIECDVVDAGALHAEKYQMIVTPALYSVREETLRKLDDFVKRGGVLVSSFKSFVADEHFSVYPDTQPHLLHRCFGMCYNQFTEPGRAKLKGRTTKYFAELLKPEDGESLADYEHKYWGKYAGITHHAYGAGHAYYIGCYTEKETLKEVYRKAAENAGICGPGRETVWPVIWRSGKNQLGEKLHYLLHYSEEEREICCPYPCVEELISRTIYHKGDSIKLKDWDVKIFAEKEERRSSND